MHPKTSPLENFVQLLAALNPFYEHDYKNPVITLGLDLKEFPT